LLLIRILKALTYLGSRRPLQFEKKTLFRVALNGFSVTRQAAIGRSLPVTTGGSRPKAVLDSSVAWYS
jgi:hypothetical protein